MALASEEWLIFNDTPEALKKGLWEQKVIRWLYRTQTTRRADFILLAYTEGTAKGRELFELASRRMKS